MALLTPAQIAGRNAVQIAFVVDDLEAAARQWLTLGAGPFFVYDKIEIDEVYDADGKPAVLSQGIALGQWGTVQVELVRIDDITPGPMADVIARPGFNHIAVFAEDSEAEAQRLVDAGHPVAMSVVFGGIEVHFHDATSTLGFVVEHYPHTGPIADMYRAVAAAAEGWDGTDPIRGPIDS